MVGISVKLYQERRSEMEWISVEDELPDMKGRVFVPTLVLRKENPYPTTRLFTGKNWNSDGTVTHWMPLPEPPKETK
jgi:hypothetical protein